MTALTLAPEDRREVAVATLEACGLRLDSPSFQRAAFAQHAEQIDTGGVRAGKSTDAASKVTVDMAVHALLGDKKQLLYWIIGPDYPQAREEFRYILSWCKDKLRNWAVDSPSMPQEGQWSMTLTTTALDEDDKPFRLVVVVETKSAMHTERLGSVAPNGILVVEAGQCPESVREKCIERAGEKGAWIAYTGTLENDELKPVFTWYSDLAQAWQEDLTPAHGAYALPSWENVEIYGNCLKQTAGNEALKSYCPDDNHGPAHSGLNHPSMRCAKQTLDDATFMRRFAGKPVGLQFKVYPQLKFWEQQGESLLCPFEPQGRLLKAVGGEDFGDVHPSVLTVAQLYEDPRDVDLPKEAPKGILWIRECWFNGGDFSGDTFELNRNKARMKREWDCWQWLVDPNERFAANNDPWSENVSGSAGSRQFRLGLLGARLTMKKVRFDIAGPGVKDAYEEMDGVHRKKLRSGELQLVRDKDDRTATIENIVEGVDGAPYVPMPKQSRIRFAKRPSYTRRVTVV